MLRDDVAEALGVGAELVGALLTMIFATNDALLATELDVDDIFPGCVGSVDCVHVWWGNCKAIELHNMNHFDDGRDQLWQDAANWENAEDEDDQDLRDQDFTRTIGTPGGALYE